MFRVCRRFSLFALLWLLIGCTPAPEDRVTVLQGAAMGTSYSIQAVDLPAAIAPAALQDRIETELERIEDRMSTYRDDSELSGFNRSRTTDWFPVSPELAGLVREAIRISEMSDGAFDPTVGPLVNLWGFGPGDDGTHAPRRTPRSPRPRRAWATASCPSGSTRRHCGNPNPRCTWTYPPSPRDTAWIASPICATQ